MSWADLRFLVNRSAGLVRRGLSSLRTRGWRASWQRVIKQFRRVPASRRAALYLPEAAPFAPFVVPFAAEPKASIVIPVFNQFAHTLACLRALAAHAPAAPVEIIVVDDGSSDETASALPQIAGLRYHRRAANGGFIAACNDGADLARGEYLVFLNNDTVPQPGWLDALLRTFDRHPRAGVVGSLLLYPDGQLQEAGAMVWRDGSSDKLGHGSSPDHAAFNFVRRVDYVSGAALGIPRELFGSLAGFDVRYAPAYFEDTDLCMRVRARGLQVLVQPASRVVHMEGVTAGTDTRRGVKAYQLRNQQLFAERWRGSLQRNPAHGTSPLRATDHHYGPIVLVIDALTPRPDHDSGSLRLSNMLQLLQEEGAHVVFLPANLLPDGQYTQALQEYGIECWHQPDCGRVPRWLSEHGRRFDAAILCRHYVAHDFLPLLRKHAPQAHVVFDTVDLHYLREQRGAEISGDPSLHRTAQRTRALELDVIARCDLTLVVSEVERALLRHDAPGARVEILSNLHRIAGRGRPFEQRHDLVFVGGFRHPPNVDAVRWFVHEAFPQVRARLPGVRFHCIGGDIPAEIGALAMQEGVAIHGHVPDITQYMDGARVAIAPLRFGAGVKGKVNMSMAHGQPVVATSCAVEGMHLRDGTDVLVADTPSTFADAVVRLYEDRELWERLAENGLRNIDRYFSPDAARHVVRRAILRSGT